MLIINATNIMLRQKSLTSFAELVQKALQQHKFHWSTPDWEKKTEINGKKWQTISTLRDGFVSTDNYVS